MGLKRACNNMNGWDEEMTSLGVELRIGRNGMKDGIEEVMLEGI